MQEFNRYTITAALPYANGPVHFGHLAGCYLPADIYARYLRLNGCDVAFVCGSDENGMAITLKALKEGVTPADIVNKFHPMIEQSFKDLGISFDIYSRTSSAHHAQVASDFFKVIDEKGILQKKTTENLYDRKFDQFLTDRYIKGTCPKCGNENAYGDQCENCGSSLNAMELINPISTLSGEKPEIKETSHWYFPLDQYQPWLEQWLLKEHSHWKSHVYGQCKSWLDAGLQPRAVTRDLTWGVPVPREDAEGKVLYVWFDAPIGYITATMEWAEKKGVDWEPYWKNKDTKLVHFIGKDNIVFHCIFFPTMLHAHGGYILPNDVPANEFLNLEGEKLSTSRNWAVWLHEYLVDFKDQQDNLRYALCSILPETKDSDFSWKDFQNRNNNELVDIAGNYFNRVWVLMHKYFDGIVPELGHLTEGDEEVLLELSRFPTRIGQSIESYKFREALGDLMNLARMGNKYLTATEPWKLIKTDPERVKTLLHIHIQLIGAFAILSEPFMPFISETLKKALAIGATSWNEAGSGQLIKPGYLLPPSRHFFRKMEDAEIEIQIEKLHSNKNKPAVKVEEFKENIDFETFSKLDIRLVTIIEAEKIAKTKKLMKLLVDVGGEQRTVVSGIAEHFEPEDLVGKQVSMLVNLAPRALKGVESQGMILMAEDANGGLHLVSANQKIENGSKIA